MLRLPDPGGARLEFGVRHAHVGRARIAEVPVYERPLDVEVGDHRGVLLRVLEHVAVAVQAERIDRGIAAEVAHAQARACTLAEHELVVHAEVIAHARHHRDDGVVERVQLARLGGRRRAGLDERERGCIEERAQRQRPERGLGPSTRQAHRGHREPRRDRRGDDRPPRGVILRARRMAERDHQHSGDRDGERGGHVHGPAQLVVLPRGFDSCRTVAGRRGEPERGDELVAPRHAQQVEAGHVIDEPRQDGRGRAAREHDADDRDRDEQDRGATVEARAHRERARGE